MHRDALEASSLLPETFFTTNLHRNAWVHDLGFLPTTMRHQDPRGRWAADGGASTSYSLGPSAAPLPSSTQAEVLFDGRDKEDVDCHHHSLEERARRTVFTCAWCALCLAGSNVLGSKVLSLGGTALFWPGPPIVAMFLVLSPLFMQRWLASTAFAVYLVMILLDFGKLNECLFLNVLFMVTDATEVFVVMTCLRAVLGIAPVSIIRTGVGINAILLFPLVLAPLKAGLNALLIYMCYGALNLPLSETLVIWLIGDLFTDFFVVYSVLVVRYYLQLYLIKVKEMKMREREGRKEPEDAGRAETANAIGMGGSLRVPHGGPGESSVGGAGRTTPAVTNGESIYHFTQTRYENGGWGQEEGDEEESEKEWGSDDSEYEGEEEEEEEEEEDEEDEEDEEEEEEEEEDEEDDEEWKFENGGREIEPGECRNEEDAGRSDFPGKWSPYAPGSGVSHHRANGVRPGMVAKTEALGPGIPSNAAAVQQAGHPVKAWLHSPRMLWDVAAFVFFLSVSILTSFATILNHTRASPASPSSTWAVGFFFRSRGT
ncbi:hypothetical protein NSK_000930 [Nannochloropsis salina CCMP1776]|uniref:Uncharacterized protein n=1 Tax=Nannochloropsis salina CCMP1776 TaxID=1027361 RepID=A0A4D9DFU6_9STRA|nr:hypothetical protein NSK_000930 [Nannochloropsis salina CCMP1776]|eukprot:TFJ87579.1 hypothetical protein NSK_000930 [Nannochloropsis salina CCMP1776]